MKQHLHKYWYYYFAFLISASSAYGLATISNGEAMSSVRTKLNTLIARYAPTNLSGGTTIATNTAYYDTLSANRTMDAFSGTPAEGDFIHLKLNVTGATRTLNLHTNNTVYRVGDSGALAAAIDFPIGTHWVTLEYTNSRWELADTGVDDETQNQIYAAPNGSNGTPTFRAMVLADIPDDLITAAKFADGDWGDVSVSTNSVTLDASSVDSGEIANGAVDAVHLSANARGTFTEILGAGHTLSLDATTGEGYGSVHYVTAGVTIVLPAVSTGASYTIIANGANTVTVDPNASDLIIRDGTSQADGVTIVSPGVTGDIVTLTYYDGTGWFATSNTWTQGS